MEFSFAGQGEAGRLPWFREGIGEALGRKGHRFVPDPQKAPLVLNFVDPKSPEPFLRRGGETFVVTVAELPGSPDEVLTVGYPLLIRSLGNLLLGLGPGRMPYSLAHFVTPERGHYTAEGAGQEEAFFREVSGRFLPMAQCRRVVENLFHPDLPESLWGGDPISASLALAGRRLGEMSLLPPPYPLEDEFTPEERSRIISFYGTGGLSYGNLSARQDGERFWMSASGVDKTRLVEIGRDILMVKGHDRERAAMVLSVPPGVEPRKVSVDAIEHWMIYQDHPAVGAVLHVHAWMEGIPSTEFNYPCGSFEMAAAVAALVQESPDPTKAVVGLKNHGVTILGQSMEEILQRVEGKLFQPVPMD